jgi:cytochrome c biogenesis factor
MIEGSLLLYSASVLYILDFFMVLRRKFRSATYSILAAGVLSIFTSLVFSLSFITDNFTLIAVYEQSSRSLPLLLKLAASWSGPSGSLLLWLLIITVSLFSLRLRNRSSMNDQLIVANSVMTFFVLAVLGFAIATNPFSELAVSVPDGVGLNPSLQTAFSVIHPPLIFAGYTTLLLCYSLVLGMRMTQTSGSTTFVESIAWRSWMLLALGISIGGYWAYETLGWGGYWAWDPLETSALIPWLALTALLLARQMGLKGKHELFALTFAASSLIFTVYIARSAAVSSVHSYGDLIGGNSILMLAAAPILLSCLTAWRKIRTPAKNEDTPLVATFIFWSLILSALVDLTILLYRSLGPNFGVVYTASRYVYNFPSLLMLMVFLTAIVAQCIKESPTYRHFLLVLTLLVAVGTVLSLLKYPTTNALTSIGLPFIIGTLMVTTYRVGKWVFARPRLLHPHSDIKYVGFLGIAVLLLGVFLSSSMATSTTGVVQVGESLNVGGVKLSVMQILTSPSSQHVFLPAYGMIPQSIDTRISFLLSNEPSTMKVLFLKYYPALSRYFSTVSIERGAFEDMCVVAGSTESVRETTSVAFKNGTAATPLDVTITLSRIPAVSLVWLGVVTLIGANLPFIVQSKVFMKEETIGS